MTNPSPSGSASKESPLVQALQALLDAEHAAVYGYGVVGARSDGPARDRARTAYDAHRNRRDAVEELIVRQGGRPRASAPAYGLPFAVASGGDAARLAAHLEDGVCAHLADVVASAEGEARKAAATWLREAAFAGTEWGGTAAAFPGLPERAAPGSAASGAATPAEAAADPGRTS
ncbi:ferritin-like domain-containing protein [Yinghuangia sp. ASG 101]|uniref:ferritin-like domain-containing protein n=1 Tax=Yinghuangia sp. ASG 101 TaxID=2896848 RepID=UPI001E475FDD|nr:ferritin-like domain-containing protein [Yinghuangia sp. ASG 101]UGQ09892.1 ferritin-like domain-containing protein [Yinghuangia sp. ASG 101]